MTAIDPSIHMENEWALDTNPFPAGAISNNDDEPWAELYPDEMSQFGRKFIRGGVRGGGSLGFLWSQGANADTGFGKTRTIREMRERINADFGQAVLTSARLRPDRMVKVAAAYANMTSGSATGLFPVLHAAVADLATPHHEVQSVLDRARDLVIQTIAERDGTPIEEVSGGAIANELRRARLDSAPAGAPVRPELIDGFAKGGYALREAIGRASDALKLRAGIAYLDFALAALKAAGIEKLYLFIDQLEDLANNRTLTRARREREVGRIRDLQEEDPYASQLRMVLTFHAGAAAALGDAWLQHRLPSFEAIPANDSSVVVLRGISSDEAGADLLRVYLDAARIEDVDDDLLPFQADAVTELIAQSQGRIGILLDQAHKVLDTAARAGLQIITAETVRHTLGGAPTAASSVATPVPADEQVDDLLLA
jgi:hypothetical protein